MSIIRFIFSIAPLTVAAGTFLAVNIIIAAVRRFRKRKK